MQPITVNKTEEIRDNTRRTRRADIWNTVGFQWRSAGLLCGTGQQDGQMPVRGFWRAGTGLLNVLARAPAGSYTLGLEFRTWSSQ